MSEYIEKAEKLTLPVLPLREAVAFPGIPISFEINDDIGRAAVDAANSADRLCLIVCAKNTSDSEVKASDLYRVGTVARLRQTAKSSSGVRIICEGLSRATVSEYRKTGKLMLRLVHKLVEECKSVIVVRVVRCDVVHDFHSSFLLFFFNTCGNLIEWVSSTSLTGCFYVVLFARALKNHHFFISLFHLPYENEPQMEWLVHRG